MFLKDLDEVKVVSIAWAIAESSGRGCTQRSEFEDGLISVLFTEDKIDEVM